MKKLFFATLIFSIVFASCTFTEEIIFNKDFSGTYKLKVDMSKLLDLGESKKNDSIPQKIMDTIISFENLIEENIDSVAKLSEEDRLKLEAIKDLKMEMHMNETKKEFDISFLLDFKNIDDLKDINEKISHANSISKGNAAKPKMYSPNADVSYSFTGKTFKRISVTKKLSEEDEEKNQKSIEQNATILDQSIYKLIYHFPKKIKSVSYKNATISEDGKTITIIAGLDSIAKNPELLDFEIKFN